MCVFTSGPATKDVPESTMAAQPSVHTPETPLRGFLDFSYTPLGHLGRMFLYCCVPLLSLPADWFLMRKSSS